MVTCQHRPQLGKSCKRGLINNIILLKLSGTILCANENGSLIYLRLCASFNALCSGLLLKLLIRKQLAVI